MDGAYVAMFKRSGISLKVIFRFFLLYLLLKYFFNSIKCCKIVYIFVIKRLHFAYFFQKWKITVAM